VSGAHVNDDVRRYIDAIPAGHRPLFDRLHGLILSARPGTISLRPKDAEAISDEEFLALFSGALGSAAL
jgi:hypothetical protein